MTCHLSLEPLKGGTPESTMQTKARFRASILKAPIDSEALVPAGPAVSPGGLEGSAEISRLDDKQRPKDERVLMSPFTGTKAAGILSNTSPLPPVATTVTV